MDHLQFSVQNIVDGHGVSIAHTGMSIVFVSLAIISTFIAVLPRILQVVAVYAPESHGHSATRSGPAGRDADRSPLTGDAALVVAIGFALHTASQPRPSHR